VVVIVRTTTIGTSAITVTPDADNQFEGEITPNTGAVLKMGDFSVEPVLASPPIGRSYLITAGSSTQIVFAGLGVRVPPGTGLGVAAGTAVTFSASDLTFTFRE
jgi:hypothetical protein